MLRSIKMVINTAIATAIRMAATMDLINGCNTESIPFWTKLPASMSKIDAHIPYFFNFFATFRWKSLAITSEASRQLYRMARISNMMHTSGNRVDTVNVYTLFN